MTTEELREEYKNNKDFYDKLFAERTGAKYQACTITDSEGNKRFDYLKMAEMYHSGKW